MTQLTNTTTTPATTANNTAIKLFGSEQIVKDTMLGFTVLESLSNLFLTAETNQLELLKEDVKKNGILSPILYATIEAQKIVIDGHARLSIAQELNIDVIPSLEITEVFQSLDEIKVWMLKNQSQRRNLDKRIRVRMAYALKESISELARKNLVLAGQTGEIENKIDTLAEIAKIAGVSRSTIAHFQKVMEKGSDEIKQKMIDGEISINKAYEELSTDATQSDSPPSAIPNLKPNYFHVANVKEGTTKVKSGELDCLMIVPKGKENLVHDTEMKTGLILID